MRNISVKIIGLAMAICLVLQMLPFIALAADIPNDLTGETAYLVVHNTTASYTGWGGSSSIIVQTSDGTEILPSDDTYADIPVGATIRINLIFHLEDGDGESEIYSYSGGHYFTFTLPKGLSVAKPIGEDANIYATDSTTGEPWLLGTWAFTDERTIRVDFTADVTNHSGMWGEIGIDGTFDELAAGDDTTTYMEFGTQEIVFIRADLSSVDISLAKTGVYDAAANEITWMVTVTPPDGISLDEYAIVDTYSANQTYAPGSFCVGEAAVEDGTLDLTVADQITYTFLENTQGVQTITYKTNPETFSAETENTEESSFTNTALIKSGDETITDPVQAIVTTDWLSKSGTLLATTDDSIIIKWTVNVTVPGDGAITDTVITDTIPAGLRLLEGDTYPIQLALNDGSTVQVFSGSTVGTYTYSYTDENTASILSCRFPETGKADGALSGNAGLTYYTQVMNRDKYLNSNEMVSFTNSVELSWFEMPDAGNPPEDTGSVTVVGSGGLLFKSGGTAENYTYPGYIHWTITINRNAITIADAIIADTVPTGQRLLVDSAHPFRIKQSGTTLFQTIAADTTADFTSTDSFVNHFSYSLGDITGTYTVDYYTEIIDVDTDSNDDHSGLDTLYSNDNAVSFDDNVILIRRGDIPVETTGTKTYQSQVLSKTVAENYNYVDHTVKWQIIVNRNELTLTNAVLTDTLPSGMVLLIDEEQPFEVLQDGSEPTATAPTVGENGSTSFEFRFPNGISNQYIVSFYTLLTDEALISQWTGTKNFTNNASLAADELADDISASATVGIRNPVITKSFSYDEGSDHIDWSVVINSGQVPLYGAYITDALDEGLQLDPDSVKLYQVDEASDGTVSSASESVLLTEGYDVELPAVDNDNTLTVTLPDTSYSYRLEFTTYILSDDLNYTNTVSLSGSSGSPSGETTASRIVISDLWSDGISGSLALTVHKEDGAGNPVAGAEYQLLNFNQEPISRNDTLVTAVTDETGDAIFSNLPSWVFFVQEISAPEGYLLDDDAFGGERLTESLTYQTEDTPAVGDISVSKISLNGTPLSGGEFTLTGTDCGGNTVTRTAESVNGIVTFADVHLGTYIIKETAAPDGYLVSDTEIDAAVSYSDDKTAVIVTVTPDTLTNKHITYSDSGVSIQISKIASVSGDPLAGAEFTLYGEAGTVLDTAVSNDAGIAYFTGLEIGVYTVKETTPPEGYVLSDAEISVTVKTADIYNITFENELRNTPVVPDDSTSEDYLDDEEVASDEDTPSGSVLPQTGGFWDTATVGIVGFILITLGLVLANILKNAGTQKKGKQNEG